jgi:hypothetical protein
MNKKQKNAGKSSYRFFTYGLACSCNLVGWRSNRREVKQGIRQLIKGKETILFKKSVNLTPQKITNYFWVDKITQEKRIKRL